MKSFSSDPYSLFFWTIMYFISTLFIWFFYIAGYCYCVVDYSAFGFHYFQEFEVVVICVFDALTLDGQLVSDLEEILACVQFLNGPLQAFQS